MPIPEPGVLRSDEEEADRASCSLARARDPGAAHRSGSRGCRAPKSRLARFGILPASVVLATAVALLGYGVFANALATSVRLLSLGVGVVLLFIAVAMAELGSSARSPRFGSPGARLGARPACSLRDNATQRTPAKQPRPRQH